MVLEVVVEVEEAYGSTGNGSMDMAQMRHEVVMGVDLFI